ncbi:MAG: VanW family protein [Clostridiales bacterium]|jgi:vancomycin resistance protein YoaR|nr:VanW family protein [Clostridiales bacterium]
MTKEERELQGKTGKKRGWGIASVILAALLLIVAIGSIMGFVSYNKYQEMTAAVNEPYIYQNILINGVDIGGLDEADALEKVVEEFQTRLDDKTITLHGGGKEFVFRFDEFDAKLDFTDLVKEAYAYAREGTLEERYSKIKALETTPYEITYDPPYSYNTKAAQEKIGVLAEQVYVAPIDATISRVDGQFSTTKEISGTEMDVQSTADIVNALLASKQAGGVDIVLLEVAPRITEEYAAQAQSLLGSFSTNIAAGSAGRTTNIRTAASKINGTTLQPGEVFSTNDALGPSTPENGYALARVIVNGKFEDDYGGGVCQVSSTLYNAVLHAELEVVERQSHSLKVGYLDYSYDATLAGDYIDLKFQNNTDLPVFLECSADGGTLTARIYGLEVHGPDHKIEFYNRFLETVQSGSEVVTYDSSLPKGERVVVTRGSAGSRYGLYKIVYEGGQEVSREQINSSYYKGTPGEVRVGTGPSRSAPKPVQAQNPAAEVSQDTPQTE